MALTKLAAQEGSPKDFIVALKVFRAGLIGYGVLDEEGLQAMYLRKKIGDDEAQFLLENGFVKEDFRPVKSEPLLQANERRILNNQFKQVFERWENGSLKESTKMYYKREAEKHPDLPNARRLLELMKEARR
ncbi:MAG: hypothetical protein HWN68_16250 [Desulfobacterales bacterium]|nr:hypothetical protein [Desulfobacterales bacterium]